MYATRVGTVIALIFFKYMYMCGVMWCLYFNILLIGLSLILSSLYYIAGNFVGIKFYGFFDL